MHTGPADSVQVELRKGMVGFGPQPDDIANRVEKECLAKKGGSDWLRMNKHTSSLEEFCRGKGLYEREEYLRRHDPDELRREHAAAQAQLNEILSSSPPK